MEIQTVETEHFDMEKLSKQILLNIFKCLDNDSLVNASRVCRSWSNVIISSSEFAAKFGLLIALSSKGFGFHSKHPNAPHRSMHIAVNTCKISEGLLSFISTKAENIQIISLSSVDVADALKIFKLLPNLRKIKVTEKSKNTQEENIELDLPNLEHLLLIDAVDFVKHLKCENLIVLKICQYSSRNDQFDINPMLKACTKLKLLTITNIMQSLKLDIEEFKFELCSLVLENVNVERLRDFLASQQRTLRYLALAVRCLEKYEIIFILCQLRITVLEIDIQSLPDHFYSMCISNLSIKKLTLRSTFRDPDCFGRPSIFGSGFMYYLPQIRFLNYGQRYSVSEKIHNTALLPQYLKCLEEIGIYYDGQYINDLLSRMRDNVTGLKVLKLQNMQCAISESDYFFRLCHLEVDKITSIQYFKNLAIFVMTVKSLKSFRVNNMSESDFDEEWFIKALGRSKNLEEIHIGMKFEFTVNILCAVHKLKSMRQPLKIISCNTDDSKYSKVYQIPESMSDQAEIPFHMRRVKNVTSAYEQCKLDRTYDFYEAAEKLVKRTREFFGQFL